MSHNTGCSRPPGEVGLTPRQYTEWNVVGRARSTGDLSQQGLLPEVYRIACTRGCAHQNDQIPKNPGSCALVVYIAGDTLHHQPMGAGHMTALQLHERVTCLCSSYVGLWDSVSCNGVTQCWSWQRGQAIAPG